MLITITKVANITVSIPSYRSFGENTVHTNKWYLCDVTMTQYSMSVRSLSVAKVWTQSKSDIFTFEVMDMVIFSVSLKYQK